MSCRFALTPRATPAQFATLATFALLALSVGTSALAQTTSCDTATGRRLLVGPGQNLLKPSAAAAVAQPGDVILIAAGEYRGDVAVWSAANLTICGSGGRAKLYAEGANAQGKAIWVISGAQAVIDGIEFYDAKVPDRNGAGIRAEGNGLTIRNSGFYDNENGVLGPNVGDVLIETSEFARNGFGDGFSHNIYIGAANKVTVRSSFFHEAKVGHNFKSRAREHHIENSYFMDGQSGRASYQIDVPNGGVVVLRGNLLHKGPNASNARLISYGMEGLSWPVNTVELTHNTLVSTRSGGSFLGAAAAVQSIKLTANVFAGTNSPQLVNPEVAGQVTQKVNLVTQASNVPGGSDLTAPNFWPSAALAKQLYVLPPDPSYAFDSPAPYVRRPVASDTRKRAIGALQAPP